MNSDFRSIFYESYVEIKEWDIDTENNMAEVFELESKYIPQIEALKILEIGFGNGDFLKWCRSKKYNITGIELIEALVVKFHKEGFRVLKLSLNDLDKSDLSKESFDLICLFDVIEHLYPNEIIDLFKVLRQILSSQGKIWIRCPNGGSLSGLIQQYKDMTHVTVISPDRIEQMAQLTQFKIQHIGNSARTYKNRKRPIFFKKSLYFIRNIVEKVFGLLYFGRAIPLDPNLVIILEKK